MRTSTTRLLGAVVLTLTLAAAAAAQTVTAPKEQFGFNIGDDYHLANYTQFVEYWKEADQQSDRMTW